MANIKLKLALIVVILYWVALPLGASSIPNRFQVRFTPVELPHGGGLATFKLEIREHPEFTASRTAPLWEEGSMATIDQQASTTRPAELVGPSSWTFALNQDLQYETILRAVLPPNDTSDLHFMVAWPDGYSTPMWVYFVTSQDTCELHTHYPIPVFSAINRQEADTTTYRALVNLTDPARKQFFLDRAAVKGLSVTESDRSGYYEFRATRRAIDRMIKEKWEMEYIDTPPPESPEHPNQLKIEVRPQPKPEPQQKPESGPKAKNSSAQGSISVDPHIEGSQYLTEIRANEEIRFRIRFWNNTGQAINGLQNGFRVYSDDGVDWSNTVLDVCGPLDWDEELNNYGFFQRGVDGLGADTVKIFALADDIWADGRKLPRQVDNSYVEFLAV